MMRKEGEGEGEGEGGGEGEGVRNRISFRRARFAAHEAHVRWRAQWRRCARGRQSAPVATFNSRPSRGRTAPHFHSLIFTLVAPRVLWSQSRSASRRSPERLQ